MEAGLRGSSRNHSPNGRSSFKSYIKFPVTSVVNSMEKVRTDSSEKKLHIAPKSTASRDFQADISTFLSVDIKGLYTIE